MAGVRDVSLEVRRGEILGIAGLVGSGRTQLAETIFGLTPADRNGMSFSLVRDPNGIDAWVEWDRYDITGRGGDSITPIEATVTEDAIVWHDLYIDVIAYPDGRLLVLDEDELAESGLLHSDPALHARIIAARDELLAMAETHAYPFSAAGAADQRPRLIGAVASA
jgi:energy-coupling factor transporter ATP-binding protein EcfA2